MRKIIVLSFISLDGVMQAPGGPEIHPVISHIRRLGSRVLG